MVYINHPRPASRCRVHRSASLQPDPADADSSSKMLLANAQVPPGRPPPFAGLTLVLASDSTPGTHFFPVESAAAARERGSHDARMERACRTLRDGRSNCDRARSSRPGFSACHHHKHQRISQLGEGKKYPILADTLFSESVLRHAHGQRAVLNKREIFFLAFCLIEEDDLDYRSPQVRNGRKRRT